MKGRTTRMLQEAIRLASQGRAVYVVGANAQHAKYLEQQAGPKAIGLGISFECPASLPNLDWETVQLKGAHPNCIVLVDHFTIDVKFASLLNMWHRYD